MATLGRGALLIALLVAAWAVIAAVAAVRSRDRRLLASGRNALVALVGAVAIADAALLVSILRHDTSLEVVWETTSTDLPLPYLLSSFWASQAGSLLLWLTLLVVFTALAVRGSRGNVELEPYLIAILGGLSAAFCAIVLGAADPFAPGPGGAGNGLNPSLQNPYMVAHPPALYTGYVGLSVPWAYCMAALLAGQTDARWIVATRRWTLAAWTALGIGMILGSHWAYVEIGWGGYWGWDPVENAALMPWLAATAFLHSVMVQERKGMLKVWNVGLVSGTFALSLFGTFLTRSGIVKSIHAFTVSSIGTWFVVLIAVVVLGSTWLLIARSARLRSEHNMESLVSREATFLFNNLLFVGMAFAVLWGALVPIATESLSTSTLNVNTSFFEFFTVAFGLPLLLLMGAGPLIAWRRASLRSLRSTFGVPFALGVVTGIVLLARGYGSSPPGVVALSLCTFVAATIVGEFVRGTRARRALAGESAGRAFVTLFSRNRRRYGGYVVHLAIVLLVIGIVGTDAYGTKGDVRLAPGESGTVGGYTLTYLGAEQSSGPNYEQTSTRVVVSRRGSSLGELAPGTRAYAALTKGGDAQTSREPAIRTEWARAEDLLVTFEGLDGGVVTLNVFVNPGVNLLWLAGIVFALGSVLAAWPDPREARRLARRYSADRVGSGQAA